MPRIMSRRFWADAVERATKSAAQTVILVWGAGDAVLNLWEIDAAGTAGFAAGGFVLSILSSVASGRVGDRDSASTLRGFTAQRPPE